MAENSRTPHAKGSRARGWNTRELSWGALAAGSLWIAAPVCAAPPSDLDAVYTLPKRFDDLLAPTGMLESSAPAPDSAQLSLLKRLEHDDLRFTGFVASRNGQEAVDYRAYMDVAYKGELGSLARMSSRAFYGTGTYDGVNPDNGALPADVQPAGNLAGSWVGADWKVESQLSTRHTLSAGVEYRQPLELGPLDLNGVLGRAHAPTAAQPARAMDIVADNKVALTDDLALKMRMRYEPGVSASARAIEPRIELLYKPEQTSTLRMSFDQAANAPVAAQRTVYSWANTEEPSNRVRNSEVAYEQLLSERSGVRLAVYRYDASGLLVQPSAESGGAESASGRIDTTGFEVGMERRAFNGVRGRVSYAWQETADWLAGASGNVGQHLTKFSLDIPMLAKSLTTSFELQRLNVVGAVAGTREREFLIGNLTLASAAVSSGTRISFAMHNLFDATDPVGASLLSAIPTDGRTLRLEVTRKL